MRPDCEGGEVPLRVAGRVDPDVVSGNAFVAFHSDNGLGDFAT